MELPGSRSFQGWAPCLLGPNKEPTLISMSPHPSAKPRVTPAGPRRQRWPQDTWAASECIGPVWPAPVQPRNSSKPPAGQPDDWAKEGPLLCSPGFCSGAAPCLPGLGLAAPATSQRPVPHTGRGRSGGSLEHVEGAGESGVGTESKARVRRRVFLPPLHTHPQPRAEGG